MLDTTKEFLRENKNLLMNNDFTRLFEKAPNKRTRADVLDFLYNDAHVDPLKYMKEIPNGLFMGTHISTIKVPENITSIATDGIAYCEVVNLIIDSAFTRINRRALAFNGSLTTVSIPDGTKIIPENTFEDDYSLSRVNLPKSVLRIKANAFEGCDTNLKIVTPYRESVSEKLTIPSNEIDFYKEHLRFTHAPKEEN